jgi:hypothetical protein
MFQLQMGVLVFEARRMSDVLNPPLFENLEQIYFLFFMVAKLVLCCSWKKKLFELAGYCIAVSIISMTNAFRVPVVNFELVICLLLPSVLACFCVLLDCEWKMVCLHACHDPTLIPAVRMLESFLFLS